jgi:large-conductance mechanosensitive channel
MFFSLALTIGFLVLALGLYRARAVHWSTAGALGAGAVVLQIGFFMGTVMAWFIVATAILLVAFVAMGRMVLMETDEEWDHTPQFRGFRPVASH